jgi:ADP-dependent NAD(P)H-hydrate dehydratase / NAD(P)H-hydrate epimerase
MKIFLCEQIHSIDDYTVRYEPITSIDLMERAATSVLKWLKRKFRRTEKFLIFAGPGNNGGDGLALARLLIKDRYNVEIYSVDISTKKSGLWELNNHRLKSETNCEIRVISSIEQFPIVTEHDKIIDAIFGSGLTRPVEGIAAEVISKLNKSRAEIISIDIPSGLFGEDNTNNIKENIIIASFTLTLQFPKLSFMFSESAFFAGEWIVLPIGLHNMIIKETLTPYNYTLIDDVRALIHSRNKFDHKGLFGHGLLISGSKGKIGAAVLGSMAALRTGAGLLTCHIPNCGTTIVQTAVPEAMVESDVSENIISTIDISEKITAVGIGPGIGVETKTKKAVSLLLSECKLPVVIDADCINIISENKDLLKFLNENTILTPHVKEFERLTGVSVNSYSRLTKQIEFSKQYKCVVVLKGAHTSISTPQGKIFFNSTGNPGMAKGGSGDVLTGILLSLLAQGYKPADAAVTGVFLHGLAGDIATEESCYEAVNATDIINCIGKAFIRIHTDQN